MPLRHMAHSLRLTFPHRSSEWGLAAMLFLWGVVLLLDPGIFARSCAYHGMDDLLSQRGWAMLCLMTGWLRLVMLGVNGLWRRSPHLRAIGAFVGSVFWFQITMSFIQSDTVSTGLAVYPVLFLLDAYNVFRAVNDAGQADKFYRAHNVRFDHK